MIVAFAAYVCVRHALFKATVLGFFRTSVGFVSVVQLR